MMNGILSTPSRYTRYPGRDDIPDYLRVAEPQQGCHFERNPSVFYVDT
ncbi:MAG: hypothetical protein R3281_12845 [Balneolaceae bacterium]|nr:hypothetical protein [Balneolaceae bacterium]